MYDAVKAEDTVDADGDGKASWIGVVYPFVPIEPKTRGWAIDENAAKDIDYLWNRAYLNAVALGRFDKHLDGDITDRPDLQGRMDYIGVNWYTGLQVGGLGFSLIPALSPKFTANPMAFEEVPNQPHKLPEFLKYVNEELGLPAVITETGVDDSKDDVGSSHLVRNLAALRDALVAGADVRGFFYWSLMDNFEWNHGMDIRMGLYAVDKDDPLKVRVPRKTVAVYSEIARFHVLPDAFVASY